MARPAGSQNKDKPYRAALVRALEIADGRQEKLDELARVTIAAARGGDMQAMKDIADRLDGKPAQAIVGGDDGDNPISIIQTVRKIVDPKSGPPDS